MEDKPWRLVVEGMPDYTVGKGMEVDSKEAVEANLDVKVDYAMSYSTTVRDSLVSKSVQTVMHQQEVFDV